MSKDADRYNSKTWESDCERWRGKVLTGKFCHLCCDWDGLPVDETTDEFMTCECFTQTYEVVGIKQRLEREFNAALDAYDLQKFRDSMTPLQHSRRD